MLQPISLTQGLARPSSRRLRINLFPTCMQRFSVLGYGTGEPTGTSAPMSTGNVLARATAFKNSGVALRRRPRWRGPMV
jgi:hypothetical protein